MALTITRARRKELARQARLIRVQGQRARWPVDRIATEIQGQLPDVLPLEAWRWAYGWTRAGAIEGIIGLYRADGLAPPAVNTAMLCRWEHGAFPPGPEYVIVLCRLYDATPDQLGLPNWARHPISLHRGGYGARQGRPGPPRNGVLMAAGDETTLEALRESVELALEVEGPAGGSQTRDNLAAALAHYDLRYSAYHPAVLAREVHQCRALVNGMLRESQSDASRRELRRIAGWLSALLGNLAFHLADEDAADVHLSTATRIGADIGDQWLTCWTTGARSMIAYQQDRYTEAVGLAQQAQGQADTPLRQAQMLAWGVLRPTAALGEQHRAEVARLTGQALDFMDAAPETELPGRFGFDRAELEHHLAEAALLAGNPVEAARFATQSLQHIPHGRPGWAAATIVLARAETARGRHGDAAALAVEVLDTIPPAGLRSTTRHRLMTLQTALRSTGIAPSQEVTELHARLEVLPPLAPVGPMSSEPNGG
jgi:hypothetical protein